MINRWNREFTDLIRSNRDYLWGNWSLATGIEVGALIQMNPGTGDFTLVGETLPNISTEPGSLPEGHKWDLKSTGVSYEESSLGADVSVGDVTASTNLKWTFSEKKQIASTFGETREPEMRNVVEQLNENKNWLIEQADKNGLYSEDYGIEQGFCVVTKVIYASGGINLASKSDTSTFSMDVSAGMVDGSASGNAGYSNTKGLNTVVSNTWPIQPGQSSDGEVAVAFEVASFTGKDIEVIPVWNRNLNYLTVEVKNVHGSLIIYAKLIYELDGEIKTKKMDDDWGISVWASAQDRIPLRSKNVRLHLTLDTADAAHIDTRTWSKPLLEWHEGKFIVEVGGWVDDPKSITYKEVY